MARNERAFARTAEFRRRRLLQLAVASAVATSALVSVPQADARITHIDVTSRTIAFGGYSFDGIGQYERIVGIAYGEIDPLDPRHAVITDIELAPRNADGMVEYAHNFYILAPLDLTKGNHKVMYEPPNRGNKTFAALNRTPGGADPGNTILDPTTLANSFLWSRGYATVWSGWEDLAPLDSLTATMTWPIPKNPDGTSITGPAYEYIVSGAAQFSLAYPAATLDKAVAKLTHRVHLNDPPEVIPESGWDYANAEGTAIRLTSGNFIANDIYEFSYIAKDPRVTGMGFVAVRDFNSFLRYASAADGNPLAGHVTRIYTEISSQPGRLLNDFRYLGFNEDESGRKVFDGHMQWISAGSGMSMNFRFSQSGRTERNRQDHLYAENRFPFANVTTTDPFTGQIDSRYARCEATGTCPLGVEIYSANEYWVKTASLLHTTPDGSTDLPDSPYTRNYLMSSMQHGTGNAANRGNCQQFQNPLNSAPVQRALFLALDKWSTAGALPPGSRVPRIDNGTMALPANVGFPTNIPDPFGETPNGFVTYTGLKSTRYRLDLGPDFYTQGIPTIFPPVITPPYEIETAVPIVSVNGPIYPSFAPTTDADGNDIAGVRLADLTVPLATYTGWALRRGTWANDGCEAAGQFVAFPPTAEARTATGDPRPSVAERYPTFEDYDGKVISALDTMIQDRLLLCEDAPTELQRLRTAGVNRGVPNPPATFTSYSFPLANISSITPSQSTLWPPNKKMVAVSLAVSAPDTCNVACSVVQITGTDGATAADSQITGPLSVNLRADRTGKDKNGRVYTMQLSCTDAASNATTKTVQVTVPHDQGKK